MTTTVKGFVKGWSNSPSMPMPYALATLDCGHVARVALKPDRGTCRKCGHVADMPLEHCPMCGPVRGAYFLYTWSPNAHNEADYVTQIGDVVDCRECANEARDLEWLRNLPPADIQHARFRPFDSRGGREGAYNFYKRDTTSPTGVSLLGSVTATPAVEAILREKRISPLSPTERA